MATAKIGYPATDNYIAYAAESAFGTAIADNQDFVMLKMTDVSVPSFNPVQYLDDVIKNRQKNIASINDYYMTESGQIHTYSLPTIIPAADDLAHLLYATAQSVSEAVGTPFNKTYTLNGTIN